MFEWEFVAFNWGFPYFDKVDEMYFAAYYQVAQVIQTDSSSNQSHLSHPFLKIK